MIFRKREAGDSHTAGESLGLEFSPGDDHYRAFVGPPADYDLVAAMSFNLLTCLGLRQHHSVLDVGCGSLRVGRLLIPYLNVGKYTGVEPFQWLVDEGIRNEIGVDQIAIKKPNIQIASHIRHFPAHSCFDFALAQSVFSHCGPDLLTYWLGDISRHLANNGVLAATFLVGEADCGQEGWIYPGCVYYTVRTMAATAAAAGLQLQVLDWKHPRQTWALFCKPGYDAAGISDGHVSWNRMLGRSRLP